MTVPAKAIPDGYHTVTPWIIARDAAVRQLVDPIERVEAED
jgi:hypothetical protein